MLQVNILTDSVLGARDSRAERRRLRRLFSGEGKEQRLEQLCSEGSFTRVKEMLDTKRISVIDREKALEKACFGAHMEIIELLLKSGITQLGLNRGLEAAKIGNHKELVQKLRDIGARDYMIREDICGPDSIPTEHECDTLRNPRMNTETEFRSSAQSPISHPLPSE